MNYEELKERIVSLGFRDTTSAANAASGTMTFDRDIFIDEETKLYFALHSDFHSDMICNCYVGGKIMDNQKHWTYSQIGRRAEFSFTSVDEAEAKVREFYQTVMNRLQKLTARMVELMMTGA